jgi:hypothetical protein
VRHPASGASYVRFAILTLSLLSLSCESDSNQPEVATREVGADTVWISDSTVEFSQIVDLALSPIGRLFVLDRRDANVRELTSDGKLVRTFGSKGEGPGEFSRPSTIGLFVDSLWVAEALPRRVSVFALEDVGSVRTFTTVSALAQSGAASTLWPLGLMVDGSLIVYPPGVDGQLDDPKKDTVYRFRNGKLVAIGARTRGVSWQFPGENNFMVRAGGQPFLFWDLVNIARDGTASVSVQQSGDLVKQKKFVVRWASFTDSNSWQKEVAYAPKKLERKLVDSVIQRVTKGNQNLYQAAKDSLFTPTTVAPVNGVLAGLDGIAWIGRRDFEGNQWQSIGPDSVNHRTVSLPVNFRPLIFRRDSVWGVLTNDEGVNSVALFRFGR